MTKRVVMLALAAFAGLSLAPSAASAQPLQSGTGVDRAPAFNSGWHEETGGRLRLEAGQAGPDGKALAALHIRLDEGFKTYWRNPGQSGIPPVLSFAGSRNVAGATLRLPPPHVFREPGDVTVGYTGEVVFPIEVTLADPARPYTLRAEGQVGFCARVCVPVAFRVTASGEKPMPLTTASLAIAAQQALVPPRDDLKVVRAVYQRGRKRLDVEAVVPDTDVHLELVVEAPAELALPAAADTVHQAGREATFSFDLRRQDGLAEGQTLRTTLVVARFGLDGRIGVEQPIEVEVTE